MELLPSVFYNSLLLACKWLFTPIEWVKNWFFTLSVALIGGNTVFILFVFVY